MDVIAPDHPRLQTRVFELQVLHWDQVMRSSCWKIFAMSPCENMRKQHATFISLAPGRPCRVDSDAAKRFVRHHARGSAPLEVDDARPFRVIGTTERDVDRLLKLRLSVASFFLYRLVIYHVLGNHIFGK